MARDKRDKDLRVQGASPPQLPTQREDEPQRELPMQLPAQVPPSEEMHVPSVASPPPSPPSLQEVPPAPGEEPTAATGPRRSTRGRRQAPWFTQNKECGYKSRLWVKAKQHPVTQLSVWAS